MGSIPTQKANYYTAEKRLLTIGNNYEKSTAQIIKLANLIEQGQVVGLIPTAKSKSGWAKK